MGRARPPTRPASENIVTGKNILVIGNKFKYIVAAGCVRRLFLSGRVTRTQAFRPGARRTKHAPDSSSRQGSEAMSPAETQTAARVGKLRPGAPVGRLFCCLLEQTFGTPTGARSPRVMQASLRINF